MCQATSSSRSRTSFAPGAGARTAGDEGSSGVSGWCRCNTASAARWAAGPGSRIQRAQMPFDAGEDRTAGKVQICRPPRRPAQHFGGNRTPERGVQHLRMPDRATAIRPVSAGHFRAHRSPCKWAPSYRCLDSPANQPGNNTALAKSTPEPVMTFTALAAGWPIATAVRSGCFRPSRPRSRPVRSAPARRPPRSAPCAGRAAGHR